MRRMAFETEAGENEEKEKPETTENPAALLVTIAPQFLTGKCDGAKAKSAGFGDARVFGVDQFDRVQVSPLQIRPPMTQPSSFSLLAAVSSMKPV